MLLRARTPVFVVQDKRPVVFKSKGPRSEMQRLEHPRRLPRRWGAGHHHALRPQAPLPGTSDPLPESPHCDSVLCETNPFQNVCLDRELPFKGRGSPGCWEGGRPSHRLEHSMEKMHPVPWQPRQEKLLSLFVSGAGPGASKSRICTLTCINTRIGIFDGAHTRPPR